MKHIRSIVLLVLSCLTLISCSGCSSEGTGFIGTTSVDFGKTTRKIGEISDPFKSPQVIIDESKVYIWDKMLSKVCIYSKKDLTKIAEFGKPGEGPMEFNGINDVSVSEKYIYVNSFPKLCIFLKDGTFVKELKGTGLSGSYKPVGKNFVARNYQYTPRNSKYNKLKYILYDSQLNKLKELVELEYLNPVIQISPTKTKTLYFVDCYKGVSYKDRFYIGSTNRGYYFAVFDENGKKLYEIDKDYPKQPVTTEQKKRIMTILQSMESMKDHLKRFEIMFPDYLPAYLNFSIARDRLYVFRYPKSGSQNMDVDVLELTGKLVKRLSIPVRGWQGIMRDRFYFSEGKMYYVEPGEHDEDTFEFYETVLDK